MRSAEQIRFPAVGLALWLVAGLAPARADGGAAPAPLPPKGWIEARTKSFTVYSDAGEGRAKGLAVQLERFAQALGRVSRALDSDGRFPTSLFAFRSDLDFAPYKLDENGNPKKLAGYFIPTPFRNYVALDASAAGNPMSDVFHEYVHQAVSRSLGAVPLWLDEGLAEFFGTFRSEGRGAVAQVGRPIEAHVALLAKQGMVPWEDVFRTTRDAPTYDEGTRQGPFHAQSWLAIHYLTATGERLDALGTYLDLLRDGADPDAALETAFGMNRGALASAVSAHAAKMGKEISIDLGKENAEVAVAAREVPPGEMSFRLGDLLAQRGQGEAARRHLDAARAAGWPAADVEAALGAAASMAGDPREAEAHLRKATDAGTASIDPYVQLGQILIDRAWKRLGASPGLAPGASEARTLFRTALERDAGSIPALLGLARTFLFEGATEPGLVAVAQARRLRPFDGEALKLDACLVARSGRPAVAAAFVARSIAPRDPETARATSVCLAEAASTTAIERINASDHEGARRLIAEALEVVREPGARARLESLDRVAASGGAVAVSDPGADPVVEAYNAAVELANAGKQEEAIARLAPVLETCSQGKVCGVAREFDAGLRRSVARKGWISSFNSAVDLAKNGKKVDAVILLRALEKQVDEPDLAEKVQEFLRNLGQKPAAGKGTD